MNSVLVHKEELKERNIDDSVVKILELIKENLEKQELNFEIDLRELGENKKKNLVSSLWEWKIIFTRFWPGNGDTITCVAV